MSLPSRCPVCDKPAVRSRENNWRPFCSERCQLIDLGAWLDGSHRIIGRDSTGQVGKPWDTNTRDKTPPEEE
ncbi:MAG: DNA gyrase inhibitor YacG [Gammaproteobacteria bacterium]|nr:DNA gyrase inhibitor YacG [Gammaproteobacteria bacterium]